MVFYWMPSSLWTEGLDKCLMMMYNLRSVNVPQHAYKVYYVRNIAYKYYEISL